MSDGHVFQSVAAVAQQMADKCISRLVEVAHLRNPIQAMRDSSVIWLQPNGTIELVRQRFYQDDEHPTGSCFVEVFLSEADAFPSSHFHRWVADPRGPYAGNIQARSKSLNTSWTHKVRTLEVWGNQVGYSRMPCENEDPFRIEPKLKSDVIALIKRSAYKEELESKIFNWLRDGHFPDCLEKLNVFGLKQAAAEFHTAVAAYGSESFNTLLKDRTRRAILDRVCPPISPTPSTCCSY